MEEAYMGSLALRRGLERPKLNVADGVGPMGAGRKEVGDDGAQRFTSH